MEGVALSLEAAREAHRARAAPRRSPCPAGRSLSPTQILVGRKGDDVAFLPENTSGWSEHGGWRRQGSRPELTWFVYDDRAMYRPGEEVHLKGWLRVLDPGEGGDVMGLAGQVDEVAFKVIGPRGNDLTTGKARVNALGGFDAAFALPKTPNLGHARVEFSARGKKVGRHAHGFQIQEFRRPEYEVSSTASEGPHVVGRGADVAVKAAYYAGGGLASADVTWSVTSSPTSFTPPNRDGYVFGTLEPWWTHRYDQPDQSKYDQLAGKTDATGQHVLHIDFLGINPPRPMCLVAQAVVQDVNRQAWAASSALVVHPSELYVGLKQERYFVDEGRRSRSGHRRRPGRQDRGRHRHRLKAVRLDWTYKKGEYVEEEVDPQTCPVTSADKAGLHLRHPGGRRLSRHGHGRRRAGRPNQSHHRLGVGRREPPVRNVEQQEVTLVPDAKEYRPGQKARLLVQARSSPPRPAEHPALRHRRDPLSR